MVGIISDGGIASHYIQSSIEVHELAMHGGAIVLDVLLHIQVRWGGIIPNSATCIGVSASMPLSV